MPDLPVIAWWPAQSPQDPSADPIGQLATRRITDAVGDAQPLKALKVRADNHASGDTDLTWTRLTPWRVLLAAALDQFPCKPAGGRVSAEKGSAPVALLAAWLRNRLKIDITVESSDGPGITSVVLNTPDGKIEIERSVGKLARYVVPGQPARTVALRRRDINELLTEDLRRMDVDDIFDAAMAQLIKD